MWRAGLWAPLLLCLLQAAPGRSQLAPPQNVTLFSQNFSVYLTWLPGPGNPQNVTYVVAYQSLPNPRRWRRVKSCVGTTELACPLMCLEKQDLYNKFKGRVKAAAPGARSPWVESEYLEYLFEVEPAPPNLEVTRAEEVLSVSASYQLPSCAPPLDLSFQVEFWKEGTRNKTLLPVTDFGEPVQISLPPTASGHHCLRARAVYTLPEPRHSQFSVPTCFFLEAPGTSWAFLVLPSLLLLLCISATGGAIWKSLTGNPWFQRAQMPQALDFSGHRPLGATFQPSGLDLPDDIVIHPQKELTRRVGLTTVRALSALQAGSGDSAQDPEEDEDADDSSSFQPYIEPPAFPGPVHLVSGYSKASGAASGECWPPVVQAEDSARASSARSWACTGDASYPWVQAGASGYLAKEGPGQGLRADRSQQSLSPPKLLEDLDFMEELPKHDLPWATSGFSWPGLDPGPGEPPVSLQTLTFHWDSGSEEGEDEDEG
uniref:Interferon lambda receptor 1 n=1 Tax=Tupaia belangeri TaxID=37347 RepID=K0I0D6_TUPBE|nr:interleukin 28 receptor 1 transcript variant 1 [Tupaia belangeri]